VPPGRRRTNGKGSPEAGARLANEIRRRKLTQARFAAGLHVDVRTVRRWISGEAGPDRETAQRLATFLEDPEVVQWWVYPDADPDPRADAGSAADPDDAAEQTWWSAAPTWVLEHRGLAALIGGVAVLALVVIIVITSGPPVADPAPQQASGSASPSPAPPVVGTGADARLTAPVDGSMTAGRQDAKTLSLWSHPSTSSGCEISACQDGTSPVGTVRLPAEVVVVCVTVGQEIRNGEPGQDGFYRDDKWLELAPGQDFGPAPPGQEMWLSNIWFLRDRLPDQLPQCQPAS
jgi:transcriptional regulator with XRE-family HTH domain